MIFMSNCFILLKCKKNIFAILFQVLVGTLFAATPEDIAKGLTFESIQWDYEEGIRNVVAIYHILEDNQGIFWLGSTNGLYRFNGSSALNITNRINDKQSNLISSKWITALAEDDTNRIWFGTTLGLFVFDRQTERCFSVSLEESESVSPNNVYIHRIAFKNESAYIGTRDGLYEVDIKTLRVLNSFMPKGKPFHEKGTKSTISNILPQVSHENLWFTSRAGLHRMTSGHQIDTFSLGLKNEEYDHFFLNKAVLSGDIFFSDYKDGIVRFDTETNSFIKYHIGNTEWSRAKSIIHLEEDLFLVNAESKGIAVFDATSGKYHWLESNKIITASLFNLYKDSSGFLWFASNGQIFRSNISFPNNQKERRASLDIGNAFANGKKLNNILGKTKVLFLNHTKNNLQVNFSLTNKWLFKDLTYQYQLDKNDWVNIIEKNKLNLFDLPAGKRHLSIRAKANESVITTSSITINVHRPFTSSPLFYTLILLGIIGLASAVYFYNKRQYEKAAKIKSKYESRLATLESQALRSQINPHFIFNTLNSIKYYSIEKSPEETSDFIGSFSTLIRRILENSKKNLITLHEEIETLRNYTAIEALRFHERFDVEYKVDSKIEIERFLIPPMIIQPFIENAIWHGLMHKSGDRKLKINFKINGIGVICEVIDNGIGREASNALKTNNSHKSSLGMKITQERMEIINVRNLTNNSFKIEDQIDKNGRPVGTKVSIYFLPKNDIRNTKK